MIIGYLGIIFLLLGIVAGLNIFVALGLVGTLGLMGLRGLDAGLATISSTFFATADSFSFSVIPMFLLMGYFAINAGLGEDLFKSASAWMGGLRGGLSIAATTGAAVFGAASGSSIGTAMVFTKLALPPMLSRGYDKRLAAGSIAIAGTLAVMIPPSALMVVYGILTQASIGKLLIAGILPGIVFACVLLVTTILIIRRNPSLVPDPEPPVSLRVKMASLKYAAPLILLVILIILGMYKGVFTPTEAGGFGAFVTFIMAIIRRRGIKGVNLPKVLVETATTSAMIFAIIMSALIFSKLLAYSGVTTQIAGVLTATWLSKWGVVAVVTLIYLVLGTLMDAPALLAVTLPITEPVMVSLGFDPIWFGVYVVLLAEIGAITPPVGINCFVVQGASEGAVSIEDVFSGIAPYVLAGLVMLVILCAFPEIALFLPEKMAL